MSVFVRNLFGVNRFGRFIYTKINLNEKKLLLKIFNKLPSNRRLPQIPFYFALLGFGASKTKNTEPILEKPKIMETQNKTLDLTEMLLHADQLFDQNHYQDAIDLLKKQTEISAAIEWRLARALYNNSKQVDKKKREENLREAYEHAKKAIELDEKDYAGHKWYAVLLDAKSELEGIKERASHLNTVKKHMVEAVTLNPEDPTSWHMLGAFSFGIADMAWYQRKIVSTLFATPPSGSYEEALEHFEKAEQIKPDFYSTNKLMLGKCYLRLNDKTKAKHYLQLAANTHVISDDDKKCKEEADQLLKKL